MVVKRAAAASRPHGRPKGTRSASTSLRFLARRREPVAVAGMELRRHDALGRNDARCEALEPFDQDMEVRVG